MHLLIYGFSLWHQRPCRKGSGRGTINFINTQNFINFINKSILINKITNVTYEIVASCKTSGRDSVQKQLMRMCCLETRLRVDAQIVSLISIALVNCNTFTATEKTVLSSPTPFSRSGPPKLVLVKIRAAVEKNQSAAGEFMLAGFGFFFLLCS